MITGTIAEELVLTGCVSACFGSRKIRGVAGNVEGHFACNEAYRGIGMRSTVVEQLSGLSE
jgi:hypothetical protein